MRPRVPQPRLLCSRCLQRAQSSRSPHSLGRVDAAAATPLSRTAAPFSARQYHGIPPHPRSLWATPRLAASVIHKRRSSAVSDAAHLDRLARSSPHYRSTGIARLEHRSLFYISGPDAAKFLQGLITNNVDPGNFDCGFYTGILNAKGRVQTDAIVYPRRGGRDEWRAFLEVDAAEARNIEVHLKRHKLKSKVKIERVDGKMSVWALWGVGEDRSSEAGFPRKIFDHVPDGTNRADRQMMLDPRASGFGFRVLAADKAMEEATQKDGSEPRIEFNSPWPLSEEHLFASVPVVALKSYHIHRYAHGIPEGSSEIIPGSALPLESNMDYMYGIDFKKGCYVGQELTIRTKHTGVVRKRILPVHLSVSGSGSASHDLVGESIPTQTIIKRISKDSPSLPEEATRNSTPTFTLTGREAGKFLGGIGNIGLALCRLDPMTKGDEEFGMEWPMGTASEHGQPSEVSQQQSQMARVKVRALVPDWHETRRKELERKPRAKGTELEDES